MRRVLLVVCLAFLIVPFALRAAENLKIAVVDVQDVIDTTDEGKQIKANLEKDQVQKQNILNEKKKELTKMKEDLEKQKLILSQEALGEKQKKLEEKYIEAQQMSMNFTQDFNQKTQDTLSQMYTKIESVVAKLAKESDYSVVLEKGAGRGVMYSKAPFDITRKVIETYNQAYPIAKGAPKK
jgi:outer membrane protein